MAVLKNRAGVSTSTAGTGTITLGSAITAGTAINNAAWQTFAGAGILNADVVRYLILDANGAWEYGTGIYTSSGTTLTRSSGAMDGTVGGQRSSTGSLLSLSGSAQVFVTAVAEDIVGIGFSAHKNNTDQSGITSGTITKVTFATEVYDRGNCYDTSLSRWTPPAGLVSLFAGLYVPGTVLSPGHTTIYIYKNGVVLKQAFTQNVGIEGIGYIAIGDSANGTDYYETFVSSPSGGGTYFIEGDADRTYFMGSFIGS